VRSLQPRQQLRQLGDVDGDAPRFITYRRYAAKLIRGALVFRLFVTAPWSHPYSRSADSGTNQAGMRSY
jgi:hypothetical protein